MKTFRVFLKGQATPVTINAEKMKQSGSLVVFMVADAVVATFKNIEVQGWLEVKQGR